MPIPDTNVLTLTETITVDGKLYTNLLHTLTHDRVLPPGCTHWGIRSVEPVHSGDDVIYHSAHDFVYPASGWVDAPGPFNTSHTRGCPSDVGDGICLAIQVKNMSIWGAVASGGRGAQHLLLAAYHHDDILGSSIEERYWSDDQGKIRLRRMHVVCYIDGRELLANHWEDSDMRDLQIALPGWDEALSVGYCLTAGATYPEILDISGTIDSAIDLDRYGSARYQNISHIHAMHILAHNVAINDYQNALDAGIAHFDIIQIARTHLSRLPSYTWARELGDTHTQAFQALERTRHSPGSLAEYLRVRRSGRLHQEALQDCAAPRSVF